MFQEKNWSESFSGIGHHAYQHEMYVPDEMFKNMKKYFK